MIEDDITPIQKIISSGSGALITSIFVTPLDVIKIRLQAQTRPLKPGQVFIYSNGLGDALCICNHCTSPKIESTINGCMVQPWYDRPSQFKGTIDAMSKIIRYEGITSLWSGLPPTLIMSIPATMIYFISYDKLKYSLGYNEQDLSTKYIPMLAGCLSRVISVTIISPIEMIRTKMQSERLSYNKLGVAVKASIKNGGAMSLMKGLVPTLFRDVPFSASYWFGYEYIKSYLMNRRQATEPLLREAFIAGTTSGAIAAVFTTPFDVIKTHRQIELGESTPTASHAHTTRSSPASNSTWTMLRNLWKVEGAKGLFSGLVPRVVKVAPACAVMITTYEYGKLWFAQRNQQNQQSRPLYDVHNKILPSTAAID